MSKLDNQLEDLKTEIADLKAVKQEFANMNKEQNKTSKLWSDIVNGDGSGKEAFASTIAKQVVDQSARVTTDRESRENNVIIFNAEESSSDQGPERKKHDEKIFEDLCTFINETPISVKSVRRIGKLEEKQSITENDTDAEAEEASATQNKVRPIKVCFSNSFDKRKFFSRLSKLKEAPAGLKDIRVQHDLSPEQREATKKLLSEAYAKNQSEAPLNFLYKVRGPPHALKIVKVYQ